MMARSMDTGSPIWMALAKVVKAFMGWYESLMPCNAITTTTPKQLQEGALPSFTKQQRSVGRR